MSERSHLTKAAPGLRRLSAGEQRIAALAAAGRTNHEIAEELGLALKTVEGRPRKTPTRLRRRRR
jgi:DNA-binding NarL/FixJ family response regulator